VIGYIVLKCAFNSEHWHQLAPYHQDYSGNDIAVECENLYQKPDIDATHLVGRLITHLSVLRKEYHHLVINDHEKLDAFL
jgi:hypothetical protein